MRNYFTILLICFVGFIAQVNAQEELRLIQSGNDLYKKQQYEKADEKYIKAIDKDLSDTIAKFNHGNALYRLGKKNDAFQTFQNLAVNEKKGGPLSKLYYNEGVILTSQQKLEESIEAYKNSLRQNPEDNDARENLQKALLELKKQNADNKKKQDQQKPSSTPQMNQKQTEQKLNQLEQKEKDVQLRLQKEKSNAGTSQQKDW